MERDLALDLVQTLQEIRSVLEGIRKAITTNTTEKPVKTGNK